MIGSLAFATSKEAFELLGSTFLDLFVLDHPVMVLVKEAEDLPQMLVRLRQELVVDVVLRPSDLVVIIQIIRSQ